MREAEAVQGREGEGGMREAEAVQGGEKAV